MWKNFPAAGVPEIHGWGRSVRSSILVQKKNWGWEILPHLPYSPDLAPSDFSLPEDENASQLSALPLR
jgi:hypothetical protein